MYKCVNYLIHEGQAGVCRGVFGKKRRPGAAHGLVDQPVVVVVAGYPHAPLVQLGLLLQQGAHGLVQAHVVALQSILCWIPLENEPQTFRNIETNQRKSEGY